MNRNSGGVDPIFHRSFGWLRQLGFTGTDDSLGSVVLAASFSTDEVVVRASYELRDRYADITIARRWKQPESAPYWSEVHLHELLGRAGRERIWNEMPSARSDKRALETIFERGASLLREVAADQLAGQNLEVLDEIIAERPQLGVPGLDFPVDEPWATSQEGFWFVTGGPPATSVDDAVDATRAGSASSRATAALRIVPGLARGPEEQRAAVRRLRELLNDPEADVRKAAASSLSEWSDMFSLGRILDLLEAEPGDAYSPFAATATFLAIEKDRQLRGTVVSALDRFASRGHVASEQVERLRWRLDDRPPRYPRVIQHWKRGPE